MRFLRVLVILLSAICLILTAGCQSDGESSKSKKKTITRIESDAGQKKKSAADKTTTGSQPAASVKIEKEIPPVYAPDVVAPFDVLVYGKIQRGGQPLKNGKLVFNSYDKKPEKNRLYGEIAVRSDGLYKFPVNSSLNYQIVIKSDNSTTWTMKLPSSELNTLGTEIGKFAKSKELNITLPADSVLTGTVTDAKNEPLSSASLILTHRTGRNSPELSMDSLATTATTDGKFRFDAAPQGVCDLLALADGYMPAIVNDIDVPTSGSISVSLSNAGGTITGRVLDNETNLPVSGATVQLEVASIRHRHALYAAYYKSQKKITEANGEFEWKNLPPVPFRISATAVNPERREFPEVKMDREPITLNDAQTTSVDLRIYPGHTIEGRVFEKDSDKPLPGATISTADVTSATVSDSNGMYKIAGVFDSISLRADLAGFAMYNPQEFVSVNDRNNYEIEWDIPLAKQIKVSGTVKTKDGVPVSNARVFYDHNQYGGSTAKFVVTDKTGAYTLFVKPFSKIYSVAIQPGFAPELGSDLETLLSDVDKHNFVLKKGVSVSGTVTDLDGKPIAGARIKRNISTMRTVNYGYFQSDTLGRFQAFDLSSEGSYLTFQKDGFLEKNQMLQDYNLAPGEMKSDVVIMMEPKYADISGKVLNPSGRPGKDVDIYFITGKAGLKMTSSQSSGRFAMQMDSTGTVTLKSMKNQFADMTFVPDGSDVIIRLISEQPGSEKDLIDGDITLIGKVTDKKTRKAIENYKVQISPAVGKVVKDKDDHSQFSINKLVVSENYSMEITAPGYPKKQFTVKATGDKIIHQDFELEAAGTVIGTVVYKADKKPVSGAIIKNIGTQDNIDKNTWTGLGMLGMPLNYTTADESGRFELTNVAPGKIRLLARPAALSIETGMDVEVKGGEVVDVGTIYLSAGSTITGKLVDAKDKPIKRCPLSLEEYTNNLHKRFETDDKGEFVFSGLKKGNYNIRYGEESAQIALDEEQTKEVLLKQGSITLTIDLKKRPDQTINSFYLETTKGLKTTSFSSDNKKPVFKSLSPGKYTYNIFALESARRPIFGEFVLNDGEKDVHKTIVLPQGRILGKAVESGGKPIMGATVSITDGKNRIPPYQPSVTSPEGIFTFDFLESGTYDIKASHPDKGVAIKNGVVVGQNDTEVKLTFEGRGGSVESLVVNSINGDPVLNAVLTLSSKEGAYDYSSGRDGQGILLLEKIPPGDYTATVKAGGYKDWTQSLKVESGRKAVLETLLVPMAE